MSIFKGAGVALVTPFKDDLSVDYEQLKKLVDFQIENGTDAIIVCGTTGESSTLTEEEHSEAIKVVAQHAAGRVPVIAGTGSNDTATAIKLSQHAEKDGVDGLLLVTPYYNKATQKGLIAHYTAIAESVNIPIILYNVPSRTGVNIEPETAVYLAKNVKNIVGIKEASGNISQVAKLMSLADGCIDLYSGNDDQILPLLSLGGIGVISVTSNIIPRDTHDICQKFFDGDVAGSRELQLKAIPLCKALFSEVNPIPVKKATEYMGLSNGKVRMPLSDMDPAKAEVLKKAMIEYGISL
ncbi:MULTISPECIES: 4-hydroxy-tetrahydrodipicolinate synthase [Eubacterium]|uniref:4-hydroxy-tetrahydrodipicolinate synthase n=1 Tax=Eubacterium ruminantium TaxID=42322 RepID=A0A1T4PUG4_9FIRM|nr:MULTISPECIES: 4-hydroxy-tetrahydrodipicolinate synthase [Eubacterium]MCR5368975.1 4-hydroxy-tetrahydrodipicolinate synthase [Eubacterium sp.]SCW62389.1 4-hydroxy-tetrahydrodipicolinate synthase [Eubacterium ruminantium]SDN14610.1 4-hydroxy-tetrahydrodipicolinate synthase [Eubacterium ruminantium]SJZ94966.1 4-hydroxy-tetrahydrodipicolinate synthase [Eubacterium ruminantium]